MKRTTVNRLWMNDPIYLHLHTLVFKTWWRSISREVEMFETNLNEESRHGFSLDCLWLDGIPNTSDCNFWFAVVKQRSRCLSTSRKNSINWALTHAKTLSGANPITSNSGDEPCVDRKLASDGILGCTRMLVSEAKLKLGSKDLNRYLWYSLMCIAKNPFSLKSIP